MQIITGDLFHVMSHHCLKNLPRGISPFPTYYTPPPVVLEFEALHGRRPSPSQRGADATELQTIKHSLLERWGVPQDKLPSDFAGSVGLLCVEVFQGVTARVLRDCRGFIFLIFVRLT